MQVWVHGNQATKEKHSPDAYFVVANVPQSSIKQGWDAGHSPGMHKLQYWFKKDKIKE